MWPDDLDFLRDVPRSVIEAFKMFAALLCVCVGMPVCYIRSVEVRGQLAGRKLVSFHPVDRCTGTNSGCRLCSECLCLLRPPAGIVVF